MDRRLTSARLGLFLCSMLLSSGLQAAAIPALVFASENSSTGGGPFSTITLAAGDLFEVFVHPDDLWSAGPLPRWSNADGLILDLFATGSDESGQPEGSHIGAPFSLWTQDGFTAPLGALVGRIGDTYMLLGTSFSGAAPETGTLDLFYWDSDTSGDNKESVLVTLIIDTSPPGVAESGTFALLALGLLGLVPTLRRKVR